jgi:hypothetical protein
MRLAIRVLVVAIGTALFIAGGLSPRHNPAVTGAEGERARQAAQAGVPGATAREVEREAGDDESPRSAYEVELVRPDGSSVEVDLDAGFNVLATDRDDDR